MHKILIFGLLLFFIPASGQAYTSDSDMFYMNIIRAQGWKCNSISRRSKGKVAYRGIAVEIECANGILGKSVYHYMFIPVGEGKYSASICWKGKCKKIN